MERHIRWNWLGRAAEKLKDAQRISPSQRSLWIDTLLIRRGCCERPKNKCKPGGQVLSDLIIRLCLDAAAFREQLVRPRTRDGGQCARRNFDWHWGNFCERRLHYASSRRRRNKREKKREFKGRQIIRLVNSFIASLSSKWVYRRSALPTPDARREEKLFDANETQTHYIISSTWCAFPKAFAKLHILNF